MDGMNSEAPRTTVPQIFCKSCASPLVQASDWVREDKSHWRVRLWCPECGHELTALLGQAQINHLSMAIEEGFAVMLEALAELDGDAFGETFLDLLNQVHGRHADHADS